MMHKNLFLKAQYYIVPIASGDFAARHLDTCPWTP